MATLASRLLLDGKLPGRLQGEGALQAAIAPHDADRDGAFSYDEYMDAHATVNRAELGAEAGGAPLQSACTFGPVLSEGVSGWSEVEGAKVRTAVSHTGEWIACHAPAAAAASAEVAVRLQFDSAGSSYYPQGDRYSKGEHKDGAPEPGDEEAEEAEGEEAEEAEKAVLLAKRRQADKASQRAAVKRGFGKRTRRKKADGTLDRRSKAL